MRIGARWVPGQWRPDSKTLEGLRGALRRLPPNPDDPSLKFLDGIALCIYEASADDRSLLREATISPNMYKPRAWVTTFACFVGWQILTGRMPTRVTKRVEGRMGVQERGEFAAFLAEVFAILGIKASAAGQVRMMQQRMKSFARPVKIP